jgi:hypothetical protein
MPPAKQSKSSSTVQVNVDTPPKPVISAPSKPHVPPKPRESNASKNVQKQQEKGVPTQPEKKLEIDLESSKKKKTESSKKLAKLDIKSDRIPKGLRDPISVHNRYNPLEEERMDTSSSHSRRHSLSPTKTKGRIKFN